MQRPPRPPSRHSLVPPGLAHPDADYVRLSQLLADAHAGIAHDGMTASRVRQRARLHMAAGNYLDAAFDAERAMRFDPQDADTLYLRGMAYLAVAAVKHGVANFGIGGQLPPAALPPRAHLLANAQASFERLLAACPNDIQARRALEATKRLQNDCRRRLAFAATLPEAVAASQVPPSQRQPVTGQ